MSELGKDWLQHPVYKDYYFSKSGEAASLKKGKFRRLRGTVCGQQGYKAVCVYGKKKVYIHRVVCELFKDRKSTRLNSSHIPLSRMPSSA